MKISITRAQDNFKSASKSFELSASIEQGNSTQGLYLASWESNMSENVEPDIKTFADFQNANISSIREELAGKSPSEALEYLNALQERFAFEIWSVKEKSHAAEILKNQIKKEVEGAKHSILPDYNPDNLSGKSKTTRAKKGTAIASSQEQKVDSQVKLMMAMGVSESEAKASIAKMMAETFQKASAKLEAKPQPKKCPKCSMFLLTGTSCLVCKVEWKECESCSSLVKELSNTKVGNGNEMKVCNECKNKE